MWNASFFAAVLLWATVLSAQSNFQPLKVNTGLWKVTENVNVSGMPPRTITYKSCVTAADLNSNPWANGSDDKCTWTVLNSSASDMEVKGTSCDAGKDQGMNTEVDIKIHAVDAENVTAVADGTAVGNGVTLKLHNTFTGNWENASCPAGMK